MSKKFGFLSIALILLTTALYGQKITFLHIPKTGGTTIISLLDKNFDHSDIYHYYSIGHTRDKTISDPFKRLEKRLYTGNKKVKEKILQDFPPINTSLVRGHFPIWFLKAKDKDFDKAFIFTVLRDPIDRVLSHHRYWRDKYPANCVQASPLLMPPNVMCRMLCSDPTLTGKALLADAIKNLTRMDAILFFDRLDDDIEHLFSTLNLALPDEVEKRNTTSKTESWDEETLMKLREVNSLDIKLYKYAKKHYQRKS